MNCRCTANNLFFLMQNSSRVNLSLCNSGLQFLRPKSLGLNVASIFSPKISFVRQTNTIYSLNKRQVGDSKWNEASPLSTHGISDDKRTPGDEVSDAVIEFSPEAIDQLAAKLKSNDMNDQNSASNTSRSIEKQNLEKQAQQKRTKTPLMDLMRDMPREEFSQNNKDFVHRKKNVGAVINLPRIRTRGTDPSEASKQKMLPKEPWMVEKERIKQKYPNGYLPLKRLSPDAMDGIRALHSQMPERFTTAMLAQEFKVSPEAIRRILKSKWRPNVEEALDRETRWFKRGEQVWSRWAELGATPPKKFRRLGIGKETRQVFYSPAPLPELITTSTRSETHNSKTSESNSDGGVII